MKEIYVLAWVIGTSTSTGLSPSPEGELQRDIVNTRQSCNPGHAEACVNRKISFNLYSGTNAGHFLLDDFLNIHVYRPEKICNVKYCSGAEEFFYKQVT
jgi:hypothetical protein